uniref:Cytochrome c oxidase subunit 2 n=1 Tax=Eucoleus annulatus TaxID=2831232 RepID=A0A8E8HTP5_9BILA|nr:cytochrome c oxidase subunit II [Eucoleus annulatus]QWC93308.1 cytochrome c oxidase subunit II [Eucoleus annulatus]
MTKWGAYYIQNSFSETSESLNNLMDWVSTMMISIFTIILWIYTTMNLSKSQCNYIIESQFIEFNWTCLPLLILCCMASVSLKTLYVEDSQITMPCLNLNVTGHQWYWEYYYPDFNISYDSFLQEWESKAFRLTECDNRVVLPIKTPIRISVSSNDVVHSWSVPSLGVKMDATPGRILSTIHFSNLPGLVYGFCAELCGVNHSFMPIAIEQTSFLSFKNWVHLMKMNQ